MSERAKIIGKWKAREENSRQHWKDFHENEERTCDLRLETLSS